MSGQELFTPAPEDFAEVFGLPVLWPALALNVDLSTISAATDVALGFGDPVQEIVDLNFQSGPDAKVAARCHLYNAALHFRFGVPGRTLLVLLRPQADAAKLTGNLAYACGACRVEFAYEVVRMWRQPVEPFLRGGVQLLPWYIVNHLGKRFQHEARGRLGRIEEAGAGVWRGQILFGPLFLIDGRSVPVERESVPLHLVGEESLQTDEALARVIVDEPGYWEWYGSLLGALHPDAFEEANRMAATKRKRGDLDLRPFIENVGMQKILAAMDAREIKEVVQAVGIDRFLESLSAQDRKKLKEQLK